ncbi:WD40/YVTN/BNR-like repeat-containing protein [Ramlibacter algicola]|uniref:WD40/YVTN/BNR-like repeat-containing protein n=1 Tax=Ramlibacter algicola TaxID=2795217 RepID=UPI001EF0DC6F|nr:sialidase family protein [Ramlibacter algicola]
MQVSQPTPARLSATLLALWLAACGGGGGDDTVASVPPPAPAPVAAGPVAAPPAPVAAPPAPAASAPVSPPVVAGPLAWTPVATLGAKTWHGVASNPTGTVLAAIANPGGVFLSRDAGVTWVDSGLPATPNWVAIDMDATGQALFAVAFGGAMYRSVDGGATWAVADTAFNAAGSLQYEGVTVSQDGRRVVATVLDGLVRVSQDGGATFTTSGGTAATARPWRWVDSSADGSVVVAVTQSAGTAPGQVHVSTDGGLTFVQREVMLGAAPNPGGWYRVAVSDDGSTMAVAGNTDFTGTSTGLFVSHDRGATWTQGNAAAGTYTSIDMNTTGSVIAATLSGATGRVLLSTNGGATFAPMTAPAGETNWRALAMNGAGTRLILAAGTFISTPGQVYLSSGTVAAAP